MRAGFDDRLAPHVKEKVAGWTWPKDKQLNQRSERVAELLKLHLQWIASVGGNP